MTDVSRAVTVAIYIERSGEEQADNVQQQQQQLQQVPEQKQGIVRVIETVKDASRTVASSNEFSANPFTSLQPQTLAIIFLT